MQNPNATCSECGKEFEVRFRYQVRDDGNGQVEHFCSQACQQVRLQKGVTCSVCSTQFAVEYPYQVQVVANSPRYFCSTECSNHKQAQAPAVSSVRRIAVFNHKGGTGKTTTAVNLAAGLAERGNRVLLIDADGQGNVGTSLGIRGEKSLYHVVVFGDDLSEVAVPVRSDLDVITSNETLAAAELYLASKPNRDRVLRERLLKRDLGYDVVVVDCAPALSLMNQNVLVYCDSVVIPVGCDYLSLVGVRQVLRTLKNVRELLSHRVEILGVLPTFFDKRNRIARDAVDTLTRHFKHRALSPIRVNTRLREAPSAKQTIFEYAPHSSGARDYLALIERIEQGSPRTVQPPVAPPVPAAVMASVKTGTAPA